MNDALLEVGPWARDKLERLRKYLSAYTTIMDKQDWVRGYVYVDAFAGSGRIKVRSSRSPIGASETQMELDTGLRSDEEVREVLSGSPRVALEIEPPFTHYVFLERDPQRLEMLHSLEKEYAGKRKIFVRSGDCNEYLDRRLVHNPELDWKKWRSVVFLDPFGMQVPWTTIAGLAGTRAIEVFLNFPLGMAIQRLLKRSGQFTSRQRAKLDDYFGDPGWFDLVYPQTRNLFGTVRAKERNAEEVLVDWYRHRLAAIFGYVSKAYLVTNSHGGHLYFLVFAGPNKTGARIANDILRGGSTSARGRS
jgi:three-Cys-motif partner protein